MSFSIEVRNELARIIPQTECCKKAELVGLLTASSQTIPDNEGIILRAVSENAATARKIFKLIKDNYNLQSSVKMDKRKRFKKNKVYVVDTFLWEKDLWILRNLDIIDDESRIIKQINWSLIAKKCCKRSYLRGFFLSRGFVNRPEANYHLEIVCQESKIASDLKKLLLKFNIESKQIDRKNYIVIYIKESEKIVDFLRIVGANKALLDFENVRILKSMRNNVNRQVNCETANLAKTVNASLRQIEYIRKVIEQNGIDIFPPELRDLAILRIDFPDNTLKELGDMMNPKLSKSGVAYRMRKLEAFCEEIINS